MLKEIEGRVAGFFKHGEFNRREVDFYLFELGDLTKADRLFGFRNLAIYDKDSGLELDDYAYAFKNLYVEYAEQWAKYIKWQIKHRVGVNEDLGHYQRVVRGGMKQLEDEIGTGDRKRILQLFPHLLYKNKVDIEQVAETWGMKRAGAVRQMKKLTDKEKGQVIIERLSKLKTTPLMNMNKIICLNSTKQCQIRVHDVSKVSIKRGRLFDSRLCKNFRSKSKHWITSRPVEKIRL